MSMTAKTSVDSVRLEMISDMKIPVPDIEEQRKIGSFLDNLDRLIALQQKKNRILKRIQKRLPAADVCVMAVGLDWMRKKKAKNKR